MRLNNSTRKQYAHFQMDDVLGIGYNIRYKKGDEKGKANKHNKGLESNV